MGCLRIAPVDADRERAPERHTRHAQDPAAGHGHRRCGRGAADDVPRPELRSSHHRRQGGRAVPGDGQGWPGGSGPYPAWSLNMAEARLDYDVMVIGGGPAGYPAAIRAAQNGLKVACVDAWRNRDGSSALGGTCLNAGCIPSKAMLESSELWHRAQHEFSAHGIKVGSLTLDLATMQKRRAAIVRGMTGGIASLFKAAGVTAIYGKGRLLARREVEVTAADGQVSRLAARHVVLPSGSVASETKGPPFHCANINDSLSALEPDTGPRRLCVIGARVIGLELASVGRSLRAGGVTPGTLEALLPMADAQLATEAGRHFKK